jgi:hypothetical protein
LVAAQPEAVRQRIRDIIYYPINQVPSAQRDEADVEVRKEYPSLFPKEYSYGLRDLVYGNQANQSTDPALASGTPPAGQESRHP